MIIDELHLSLDERRKIEDGERSEFADLLKCLRERCVKTVIVLSSSSSSDVNNVLGATDMSCDQLTGVIHSSGYHAVILDKVMRNTSSITKSVSAESWNSYRYPKFLDKISPSIPNGHSSTVTGHKPTAILYKESDRDDYSVLGQCVERYLDDNPNIRDTKLAILCDQYISVRRLKPEISSLFPDMKCYDAGIEKFDYSNRPVSSDNAENSDEDAVIKWFEEGGTLLTHAHLFRGCEAESVIVVSRDCIGYGYITSRSALTRGVANMAMIVSNSTLKTEEMEKHFKVTKHKSPNICDFEM